MRKSIAFLVLVVTSLFVIIYSQQVFSDENEKAGKTKVSEKNEPKKNDTLVIVARIIEIAGTFAANDLYNYVYIMKYRIIKVERGKYTNKEILVGQYNPLIPRKKIKDKMDAFVDGNVEKFEEGDKHKLVLITPIEDVWNEAIEDEYFDSDLEKYFALRTDLVK